MKIGCHVSCAGGVWFAPERAKALGCETFQTFTRSPQGGRAPAITDQVIADFKAEMEKHQLTQFVIHAPYFVNLGSIAKNIYYASISVLKEELHRSDLLGAEFMMVHLGTFKDIGQEKGMIQVMEGLDKILEGYTGNTKFLIENAAGAGSVIGANFDELATFADHVRDIPGFGGFCFDTQHGFASGFDMRTGPMVKKVFKEFDTKIGLEYFQMVHANDSKIELGGKKDRHEHISAGHIGKEGFAAFIDSYGVLEKKSTIDKLLILETEHDAVQEDIQTLKELRDAAGYMVKNN